MSKKEKEVHICSGKKSVRTTSAAIHFYAVGGSGYKCENKATIFENGRWYCKLHAPSKIQEREDKNYARYVARIKRNLDMNPRQLTRDMLPNKVTAGGTNIPVLYKGEQHIVVDVNYANDELCYLKDNGGEPVRIDELKIKEDWVPLLIAFKKLEAYRAGEIDLEPSEATTLHIKTAQQNWLSWN